MESNFGPTVEKFHPNGIRDTWFDWSGGNEKPERLLARRVFAEYLLHPDQMLNTKIKSVRRREVSLPRPKQVSCCNIGLSQKRLSALQRVPQRITPDPLLRMLATREVERGRPDKTADLQPVSSSER